MKLVRGEIAPEPEKHIGFIVIGDGSRDEKIMRALLARFNDEKAILMLQDRPSLKLEGSIAHASYLVSHYGKDVLIVIDREHFDEGLLKRLLNMYFSEHKIKRRSGGFRHIEVKKGAREASLYIAIMGAEKAIEEVEVALIREIYGATVEPSDEAIIRFLKERGLKIYDLIEKAGEDKLMRAFPSAFINFLKRWARDS